MPDCANGSETATIHACMATVSIVIKDFVNSGWVFGPEFGATTELATALWRDGIGIAASLHFHMIVTN